MSALEEIEEEPKDRPDLVVVRGGDEENRAVPGDVEGASRPDLAEEDGDDNLPCRREEEGKQSTSRISTPVGHEAGEGAEREPRARSKRRPRMQVEQRGGSGMVLELLTEGKHELVRRQAVEDKGHAGRPGGIAGWTRCEMLVGRWGVVFGMRGPLRRQRVRFQAALLGPTANSLSTELLAAASCSCSRTFQEAAARSRVNGVMLQPARSLGSAHGASVPP